MGNEASIGANEYSAGGACDSSAKRARVSGSVRAVSLQERICELLLVLCFAFGVQACNSDGEGDGTPAPPSDTNLSITPLDAEVDVGGQLQMAAQRRTSNGASETVTTSVTWQSSNNSVASFDSGVSTGLLTARAPGSVEVTATLNGESTRSIVTVRPTAMATQGPLRVSSVNPRYFETQTGVPIVLAGSHTWTNLQDNGTTSTPAPFDYAGFLNLLADNGHNFFRLWAWEQARWSVSGTEDQNWIAPSVYERATGSGVALDGLPKFDLSRFNQAYFDRMRSRVEQARDRGIYVSIMLFNGFSVTKAKPSSPPQNRNPWRGHPFHSANNINNVNGDPDGNDSGEETHELAVPAVTAFQREYVRKVIDTVNDLDNVLYEISNESHAGSHNWQYAMIDFIHAYEATKPRQHPVGMTAEVPNGSNSALLASNAEWISPIGDVNNRPIATGSKVILVDTDHLCGVCGDRGWVWRSFTAGENPVLMDPYDRTSVVGGIPQLDVNSPELIGARENLGHVIRISKRMNLGRVRPRPELASSSHCLADLTSAAPTVVVYLPAGDSVEVDLGELSNTVTLGVEWLRPATGVSVSGTTTSGGARRTFRAPFSGDAVLFLHSAS